MRLWGAFEAEPKCLTLPSEAHKKRGGRLRTGHREAARGLPAAERLLKPVQKSLSEAHKKRRGRPASCREEGKAAVRLWGAFEAEPKCLTLPSEAHKKRRGRPASCREEGKAAVRLWGAFEAEPKCLTLPSEAHKKRGGRLRTGHREAARGLPAAERLLNPVQNA